MTARGVGSDGRLTRAWRRVRPGKNPLARSGDRWDGRLLVMLVVLVIAAVPAAVGWGGDVYGSRLDDVARDAATKHQVTAVLTAKAPVSATAGYARGVRAPARWTAPEGGERTGSVPAYRGATRGTEVTIWVDRGGAVASPPVTRTGAVVDGASAGLALWLLVAAAGGLGYGAFRALLARSRQAWWDREWQRAAQDWARQ
ncbi:hypothetical protein FHS23_002127 [Prauserella isguenensis]|uniref:Transmembrane protein n=1 Tax=Prauserella isguenensis TaxID=1470180 RepID=A0A839S1C4_9PSEU|nr:hypothetical protein [Prauserella isguenensis]MBB3051104.1 hypothetical protein [Prauserella isguenensis]